MYEDEEGVPYVPKLTLNNGRLIPSLGLSYLDPVTVQMGEVTNTVMNAIDAGFRYINVSVDQEEEIGLAIRAKLLQGVVRREDLFITFKQPVVHHITDLQICLNCENSLNKLGLTYFDLMILTKPRPELDDFIMDMWYECEDCVATNLTRSIGVADFYELALRRILSNAKIKPVVNEMDIHLNNVHLNLIDYCTRKNVRVVSRRPFGHVYDAGILHINPPDQIFYDIRSSTVVDTAIKWEKTPFQVVLKYMLQSNVIPLPREFPGFNIFNEYLDIFDFELEAVDMVLLRHLNMSPY